MGDGIGDTVFFEFPFDMPVAVCHDVIVRGTTLDHIILDDAAPGQAVIEAASGRVHQVFYRDRRKVGVQFKDHIPEAFRRDRAFHLSPLTLQEQMRS